MEGKRESSVPQKRQQQQQAPQQREARRGLFTGPKPLYGSSMPQVGHIMIYIYTADLSLFKSKALHINLACPRGWCIHLPAPSE